jgi:hypothetical protein
MAMSARGRRVRLCDLFRAAQQLNRSRTVRTTTTGLEDRSPAYSHPASAPASYESGVDNQVELPITDL